MKNYLLLILLSYSLISCAQEIIKVPFEKATDINWSGPEKEYLTGIWNTQVVTNVSIPTMQVFEPNKEARTGTAVIVAPGGGLYAHSIESEGRLVAKWLAEKGITAFVLKYRLVPTGDDGVAEFSNAESKKRKSTVQDVMPYSIADGLSAISYVRKNANKYGVNPQNIGFMGFSAGGAVTMGVGYNYTKESRPNFLVPIYPWTTEMPVQAPQKDSPPMLIVCASDDGLDLAPGSIELYNSWLTLGQTVGLHMYSKGGHGFGMREQNLPSDQWIERFYEWALAEGLVINK